ncbi:MAG: histidine--tRNA ligase [Caldisericaceae bacterium]|nr:histidine--tRNA ligase [Caldisericaceae bacterium]
MIKTVRGCKDIYGEDAEIFRKTENVLRETVRKYGFKEIIPPVLEYSELFERSVGEGTDIVEKEMYTFTDKGGRSVTLRPEMTASVARAYVEHHFETMPSPLKLFYIGPCFRYEKPQKGRYREFYQFGVEVLGDESPLLDAEVISLAYEVAENLGLENLKVRLNSIGCKKCRPQYKKVLQEALKPHYDELCEDCKRRFYTNPLRILDCKKEKDELKNSLPKITDYLCGECKEHFEKVKKYLDMMNIPYELDNTLVRGLDYYTKTVFEVVSGHLGAQNALLGGGRYDYLIEELGGRHTPGLGFAIGMERLVEVMKAQGSEKGEEKLIYIAYMDGLEKNAFSVASIIRNAGFTAIIDSKGGSIGKQLKHASKRNASFTVIIGEEEAEKGTVQLKDMKKKKQKEVEIEELVSEIGGKNA